MSGISISNGVLVVTDNQTTGTQPVVGQVSTPSQNSTSVPLNGSLSGTGSLTLSGLTTLSNETYLLEFENNHQGQVIPAASIVYKHILTNKGTTILGDSTNELSLSVSDSLLGFTTVIYYDANNNDILDFADGMLTSTNFHNIYSNGGFGLDVNESITIFAKLTAPFGATLGTTNNTILRATIVDVNSIEHSFFAQNTTAVVTPQDILPTANDDYVTTDEFSSVTVDVVSNDFDFNGDPLVLANAILIQGQGELLIDGNNITVIPLSSAGAQQIQVSYNVTDGINTSSATLNVAVLSSSQSNQAPTPQQDSASVYEFGTIDSIDVLSNDSDPEGDNLTVISAIASSGSAFVNENNTISYTAGSAGIDYITYTVQDIFGNTAESVVVVDVLGDSGGGGGGGGGFNNAPVANDDYATTDEFTPVTVNVVANDIDIDGNSLVLEGISIIQGQGEVLVDGNNITVIPLSSAGAQDIQLSYSVTDGISSSAATLNVTVSPTGGENNTPIANIDNATTLRDKTITIDVLANDYDIDGDTLVLSNIYVAPEVGQVSVNEDNTVTFTPNEGFVGQAEIEYTIADSSNATASSTLLVNVLAGLTVLGTNDSEFLQGSLLADTIYGLDGDDTLLGDAIYESGAYLEGGDDILIGGVGSDYLAGLNGNDTYIFNLGDGADVINNYDPSETIDNVRTMDRLVFGAGIAPNDIDVRFGGVDFTGFPVSISLAIRGTNDVVVVVAGGLRSEMMVNLADSMLDIIEFSDGTVWTKEYVLSLLPPSSNTIVGDDADNLLIGTDGDDEIQGLAGDDILQGGTGDDILNGGMGDDTLQGGEGSDSYIFNVGAGHDVIDEYIGEWGDTNYLVFGEGINPDDLELRKNTTDNDLIITIKNSQDSLTIRNYFNQEMYPVNWLKFANNPNEINIHTLPLQLIGDDADNEIFGGFNNDIIFGMGGDDFIGGNFGDDFIDGGAGNDQIFSAEGKNTVVGGLGNDYLTGGQLATDTYIFNLGDGQDVIDTYDYVQHYHPNMTENLTIDTLKFGVGISADDIELTAVGDEGADLLIRIRGTEDSILVRGHFHYLLAAKIDVISFADGTVWDTEVIANKINQPPVLFGGQAPLANAIEDNAYIIHDSDLLVGYIDADGDVLSVINLQADHGVLIKNDNGTHTFTPDANFNGRVNLSYQVSDGRGGVVNNTLNHLFVEAVNDAPMGNPTSVLANGEQYIAYTLYASSLLAGFSDVENDNLSITNLHAANATIEDNGDGSFTVKTNATGQLQLSYQVVDGHGALIEATQSLLITPRAIQLGTENDDVLGGDQYQDTIQGLAGNDYIVGNDGNDSLDGGAGHDTLDGGEGNDSLYGGDAWQETGITGYQDVITGYQEVFVGYQDVITGYHEVLVGYVDVFIGYQEVYVRDDLVITGYEDIIVDYDINGQPVYETRPIEVWQPVYETQAIYQQEGVYESQPVYSQEPIYENQPIYGQEPVYGVVTIGGDDTLIGGEGDDTLIGGKGDDSLNGGHGSDTYVFNLGDGKDVISNADDSEESFGIASTDTLVFGTGINVSDIRLTYSTNNYYALTLSIQGTIDSVVLYDYFKYNSAKIDLITFTDGTVWDRATLESMPIIFMGTESHDSFNGSPVADLMYGMGGNDWLSGNYGNDTMIGGLGDDYLYGSTGDDVLIGRDASYQQVFTGHYENVYVEYDSHTGTGGYYESRPVYNSFFLRDNDILIGGTGNNTLIGGMRDNDTLGGGQGNDVLIGGTGNDNLSGHEGADTYVFNLGDGEDNINNFDHLEEFDGYSFTDTLAFGAGINASDIRLNYRSGYNLIISINGTTDSVILLSYFDRNSAKIDLITFADGTVWDRATLDSMPINVIGAEGEDYLTSTPFNNNILYGLGGNDTLNGGDSNDTLIGGQGNDSLNGGQGDDTYVFNLGDGQDIIDNEDWDQEWDVLPTDTVAFGDGVNVSDIRLNYGGDRADLILSINSTTDSITLQRYFSDSFSRIDLITFSDGTVWTYNQIMQLLPQPPVLTGAQAVLHHGEEDVSYTLHVSDLLQGFTDINGDVLSIINLQATNGSLIDNQNGTYSFSAHANFNGTINISYQVSDGKGGIANASNSFVIDAVNDAPTINPNIVFEPKQIDENQLLSFTFSEDVFADIDGDQLTYMAMQANGDALPSWLSFDSATRTFMGTPSFNDAANLMLKVIASDSMLSTEQVFSLMVNNVNRLPTGSPTVVLANVDKGTQSYNVSLSDLLQGFEDADGDLLTISNLTSDHATVVNNNNGTYTLTLEANYDGVVSLNYQVSDGLGGSINAVQTFNVLANTTGTLGADILVGGVSDDTYIVNNTRDVVVETQNNGGIDTVQSSLSYNLGHNLENLVLVGTTNLSGVGNNLDNMLTGNDGNNRLLTGFGNDTLYGGIGSDTLNGGEGADVMKGGLGNDTFTIENANDLVVEFANEGYDSVNSFITYTLTTHVERLNLENAGGQIDGFGNDADNTLNGNNFANYLFGGAGNDTLQGKAGADTLEGGLGDDVYYVDNVGDVITELAGEGIDKVNSTVSYTLTANVEQLYLTGIAGLSGTGNAQNNIIYGNSGNNALNGSLGNDSLNGGAGNDTLEGGQGNDTLVGGLGNDTYRFGNSSGRDTIDNKDSVGNDVLLLAAGITAEQVWLRQLGNDLEVSIIGTNNSAKVKGWYGTDEASKIDSIQLSTGNTLLASEVQYLVEAMAAFTPPPLGQTTLNSQQQSAFGTTIAIVWETITGTA